MCILVSKLGNVVSLNQKVIGARLWCVLFSLVIHNIITALIIWHYQLTYCMYATSYNSHLHMIKVNFVIC